MKMTSFKLISCLMMVSATLVFVLHGTTNVAALAVNGFVSPTRHSWEQSISIIKSNKSYFELGAQHNQEEEESSSFAPYSKSSLPYIPFRDGMKQQQPQHNNGNVLSLKDYLALESCLLRTNTSTHHSSYCKKEETNGLLRKRFVFGMKLKQLRSQIVNLQNELQQKKKRNKQELNYLRQHISRLQLKDAELVYKKLCDMIQKASNEHDKDMFRKEARMIKETCLPQYNLEGYWIGQYPKGMELIHITYVGDDSTLVMARKVATAANNTGNRNIRQNVPQDEITFTADLKMGEITSHSTTSNLEQQPLTNINDKDVPIIQRFLGKGQVSNNGYKNAQYVSGQLIVFSDATQFSFVWEPVGIQVFFERPSDEQLLQMIRQKEEQQKTIVKEERPAAFVGTSLNDDVGKMRQYLTRCYESSEDKDDDDDSTTHKMLDESIFLEPNNNVHFQ